MSGHSRSSSGGASRPACTAAAGSCGASWSAPISSDSSSPSSLAEIADSRTTHRQVQLRRGDASLCPHAPRMGIRRAALRALRPGRPAHDPRHRRRDRKRVQHGHRLHLALLRVHLADGDRASAGDETPGLLDARGGLVPLARALARSIVRGRRELRPEHGHRRRRRGRPDVAEKLLRHPEYGVNVVGFVDSEPKQPMRDVEDLTILGPPERPGRDRPRLRRRARDHRLLP